MRKPITINGVEWTVEKIKERIATDPTAAIRALLRIYNKQTAEERSVGGVKKFNGVGFNKFDAPYMTQMAQEFNKNFWLQEPQMKAVMQTMPKYAGQILDQMWDEHTAMTPQQEFEAR